MRTRMCEIIDDNVFFFIIIFLYFIKQKGKEIIFMFESQVCCTAARHPAAAC